jgi:hypothetical protein
LRAVRSHLDYAGLLTVQGGIALGRVALTGDGVDKTTIATVMVPLDAPSAFQSTVTTGRHHVGPIATQEPTVNRMLARMTAAEQAVPVTALLLPIVLRGRVVAIVIGHRDATPIVLADVMELLPLANAAADALSRLIAKSKSAGFRSPTVPD